MTTLQAGRRIVAAAALLIEVCAPAWAKGGTILYDRPGLEAPATIVVSSPAFPPGNPIPQNLTAYGQDISMPVTWTHAPSGTASLAVAIEDPDAPPTAPIVHWLAWNIPPTVTSIAQGAAQTDPKSLAGMRQGRNSHEGSGYYGPHPPANDPPHHYHVQVYALDRTLDLPEGSTIDELAAAMKGHIKARGQVVGTFGWPQAN